MAPQLHAHGKRIEKITPGGHSLQMLGQVHQNTVALTDPKFMAAFCVASTATAIAPQLAYRLVSLGPDGVVLAQRIVTGPRVLQTVIDVIEGYTPGPVPATWGGLAGFMASTLQNNWPQISRAVRERL